MDTEPAPRRGVEHRYLIAFAVVVAALMQVIDSSIVNVALPDMMGNLGANLDEIAWVSTGYILANVIVIPLTGWLGSYFGRKRYFVGSIVLFTTASFLCGASHSLSLLIFWRVVQGIGGGALMTVSQAVLFESFPAEEAGTAMALFGVGVMVGPTIGPTLGGWLTDNYSWPWIFYVNIPVGILAAILIATYVHDTEERKPSVPIDYIGILLLAVGVGAIQFVLEHGQREDWFASSLIITLSVIGVVASTAMLWRELTTRYPAIEFRVLRHRPMWIGTMLSVIMGVGLYASVFTLPIFLQGNLHITAEQTGIVLFPGAVATAVSMFIVGRLINRIDPRLLIATGAVVFAWSMWQLSMVTGLSGRSDFFAPLIARGMGLGMMFVPLTTMTLSELSSAELPQGTGLYNFFRQLGGSFGIAGVATLLLRYTQQMRAQLIEHVSVGRPEVTARLAMLTHGFLRQGGDPVQAHARALRVLDLEVQNQADVLAYGKIYLLSALLVLTLLPLLLLVRRPQRRGKTESHLIME